MTVGTKMIRRPKWWNEVIKGIGKMKIKGWKIKLNNRKICRNRQTSLEYIAKIFVYYYPLLISYKNKYMQTSIHHLQIKNIFNIA